MALRRESSSLPSALPVGTTTYASIRRSSRLASKAAHLLGLDASSLKTIRPTDPRGSAAEQNYLSFSNNIDQDESILNLAQVAVASSAKLRVAVAAPLNTVNPNQSMLAMDDSVMGIDQAMIAMDVTGQGTAPISNRTAQVTAPWELKRGSVRMSIRRSLQPLANILSTGKRKKKCHSQRPSLAAFSDQQKQHPTVDNDVRNVIDDSGDLTHIYRNSAGIVMDHRGHPRAICASSVDLNSAASMTGNAAGSDRIQPSSRQRKSCGRLSMNPNADNRSSNNVTQYTLLHEFRMPMVPPESRTVAGRVHSSSLLRQENVHTLPPPRRQSTRVSTSLCESRELHELRKYDPSRVLRLRELPANLPKRKIHLESASERSAAHGENLFVVPTAFAVAGSGDETERKRRKTVRFQDSGLVKTRPSDQGSGRAKLQLCLYINHGHLSLHVIRGANLPLLPDQHEVNSFVKVTLEPKDVRSRHRSQLVSATVDPVYDFRLSFELSPNAVEEQSLFITVWHKDYITKQSRLLGFLNFSVKKIVEANRIEGWFKLPSLAITKKTQT